LLLDWALDLLTWVWELTETQSHTNLAVKGPSDVVGNNGPDEI